MFKHFDENLKKNSLKNRNAHHSTPCLDNIYYIFYTTGGYTMKILLHDQNNNLIENREVYRREDGQWVDTWWPKRIINSHEEGTVVISCRDYRKELERVIMSKSHLEKIFSGVDVLNIKKRMEKLNEDKKLIYSGHTALVLWDVLCMNIETHEPNYRSRHIVAEGIFNLILIVFVSARQNPSVRCR
jgi:hypothetical protein